jgi:hypothetical protein
MLFPPSRSRSEFAPSRFSLVSTVYENAQRATKQAVDVAQGNPSASMQAASAVTEAADEAVEKAQKQ